MKGGEAMPGSNENNYISIKEFAELAGVSRQAIQQRLKTSLAQYVKANEQGIKTIDKAALRLFGEQGSKAKSKANEQGSKANEQGTNAAALYDALLQTVEILQGQLEIKDKQIEALTSALATAQQSATQAQALHAGTMAAGIDRSANRAAGAGEEGILPPLEKRQIKKGRLRQWKRKKEGQLNARKLIDSACILMEI